ncbi:caspase family protein [Streptomyces sp. KL116D]|uniref:caspase family protein n=1 Tax=Streptomyces sp. KL116D TaxID=3045152 RepID=UPI0035560D9B
MGKIHALLAGVNAYPRDIAAPLSGCVNDIESAGELIAERARNEPLVRTLLDGAATVAAVSDGIREVLGTAGPGDTALFWFAGHGTEEIAHGADLLTESTGRNQALVCADGPLLDKRLAALLDAAAAGGAQVVAVLDCCHSGGGSRKGELRARFAAPAPGWDLAGAARELTPLVAGAGSRHVLLAASRSDQRSFEGVFGGRTRGVFSHALVAAARAAGPGATYRQLLAATEARVRHSEERQQPILLPTRRGGPADRPFLGGELAQDPSPHLLRNGPRGWEVDCGTGHGLPEGTGARGTEFTVLEADEGAADAADPAAVRAVRTREALADRSLVEPVEWAPRAAAVYPVALSALALSPATFDVTAPTEDELAGAQALLTQSLATAGPGGGPAPLLRAVGSGAQAAELHFRVDVRGGSARVLRRDGTPFVAPLPFAGPTDADRVVDCLSHLTRWYRLRDLTPRPSLLDNLVQVEIVPWGASSGERLLPDGNGELVCAYEQGRGGDFREPLVSVRLHNRSPHRALWCVLLDLTEGYGSHATLFPGHFIAPGHTGYALDGDPVELSLPRHRPVTPGAEVRDWLKLIVAEGEMNTLPFELPAWNPATTDRDPSGAGDPGLLRFAPPVPAGIGRDAGRVSAGRAPGRWTSRTLALRTVVPATGPGV